MRWRSHGPDLSGLFECSGRSEGGSESLWGEEIRTLGSFEKFLKGIRIESGPESTRNSSNLSGTQRNRVEDDNRRRTNMTPHIVRTVRTYFLSSWNIFVNFDSNTLKIFICTLLHVMNIF